MKVGCLRIFLFCILMLFSLISNAHACSCTSHPEFIAALFDSDGAFQGRVINEISDIGPKKIVFDIHMVQKGDYPHGDYILEDSSVIYFENNITQKNSCEVHYKTDGVYQVFIHEDSTSICDTKQISGHYDITDVSGKQHTQSYNFFTQYSFFSIIVPTFIMAGGFVFWRKFRKHHILKSDKL